MATSLGLRAAVAGIALSLSFGGAGAGPPAAEDDGATVLARFLGTWRTETTVRDAAGKIVARTAGTATGARTLEGRGSSSARRAFRRARRTCSS